MTTLVHDVESKHCGGTCKTFSGMISLDLEGHTTMIETCIICHKPCEKSDPGRIELVADIPMPARAEDRQVRVPVRFTAHKDCLPEGFLSASKPEISMGCTSQSASDATTSIDITQ